MTMVSLTIVRMWYSCKYTATQAVDDTSSWYWTFSLQSQSTFDSCWHKTQLYIATLHYSKWYGQSLLAKVFSRKKALFF